MHPQHELHQWAKGTADSPRLEKDTIHNTMPSILRFRTRIMVRTAPQINSRGIQAVFFALLVFYFIMLQLCDNFNVVGPWLRSTTPAIFSIRL